PYTPGSAVFSCNARRVHTFGSFTSFPPSPRVRVAPKAGIRPLPPVFSAPPTARPKIKLLKSRRSPRARCPAGKDSTPVAWYRSLYAPRTGGAYDSPHRTSGIAGRTRRGRGFVAARGARPTAGDAGDRFSPQLVDRRCHTSH